MTAEEKLIQAIKETAKEWLYDTKDFTCYMDTNSGSCGDFALRVNEKLKGEEGFEITCTGEVLEKNGIENYGKEGYSNHVWIKYNDKHYDIERINGVEDWRELPYFKREEKMKQLKIYDQQLYELILQNIEEYKDLICDSYV